MIGSSTSALPFYGQYPAGYKPPGAGASAANSSGDTVDIRGVFAGSFTAAAGDVYSLDGLYAGTAPPGGSVAGYKVAIRGGVGPQLSLNGADVSSRTSFTASEFASLTFTAGPAGSSQDLVVVAQTGTRAADGTLSNITDSPAVQVTASVTGTRSINALGALRTAPTGADAAFVATASEASIFTGLGGARPSVTTVGNLTAAAGDVYSLDGLYAGTAPPGGSVAGYKVAIRGGVGPQLSLNGADVSSRTSFTASEFASLTFTAGPAGSSQDLVVVAQTGTRAADGTLSNITDSPAVQVTASVTGTRSINALGALRTAPTGADAAFVATASEASIFTGLGGARPSVTTVGNLTAAAGDVYSLDGLYAGTAPPGGSVAGYKVAIRGGVGPQLSLNGADVSSRTSFTASEFASLTFTAGPAGSSQDLVVVAQTGTRAADGTLSNITDSPAVQVTASVTGTRSINALGALRTAPTGADAAFVATASEASIFTGLGGARPSVTTVGNLTAAAGDVYSLDGLYAGTAPPGGSVAGYKVAIRGGVGPQLSLNGADVSSRTSFTASEFASLTFTAGPAGSSQDLVVVAQTGTRAADGTLSNITDSPAVQVTASVTGTRSINALGALRTAPTGADAAFVATASEASIFTGLGGARPSVTTVGNLTAAAGDVYSLDGLYAGTAPPGGSVAGYKVAIRGGVGPQLSLNGADVSSRTSFTASEFASLTFTAGPAGSSQDLVVVAQTGTRAADGTLSNITDSPAVQVTASVTGTRSINALGALRTAPTGADAAFVATASEASIFTGLGGARPRLTAVGTPSAPNLAPEDLVNLVGAYQSSEPIPLSAAASPGILQTYPGAIGGREMSGGSSALAIASWLLSNAQVGGLQTSGSNKALQRFAVAAYESGRRSA